jgi:hypothetical protein
MLQYNTLSAAMQFRRALAVVLVALSLSLTLVSAGDTSFSITVSGGGIPYAAGIRKITKDSQIGTTIQLNIPTSANPTTPIAWDTTTLTHWLGGDNCLTNPSGLGNQGTLNVPSDTNQPRASKGLARWTGQWGG